MEIVFGRRLLSWSVAVIVLLPALACSVAGDGIWSVHTPDAYDRWSLVRENTQFGLVNVQNGAEQMIIAINVDASTLSGGDHAFWLFAVPSAPESVSIDMLPEVPQFGGSRLGKMVEDSLGTDLLVACSSQIYPVLLALPFLVAGPTVSLVPKEAGGGYVDVHEHLDKLGMTTEVIAADNSTALYSYLDERNLSVPSDARLAIESQIQEGFSFVLSWVAEVAEFMAENEPYLGTDNKMYYSLGVWVRFPSDRVFYPLKLTSAYGEDAPTMVLQIMGFVSYGLGKGSRGFHVESACYVDQVKSVDGTLSGFFNVQAPESGLLTLNNVEFTEMMITIDGNGLSDDLWLDDSAPARANLARFVIDHSWVFALSIFVMASMLASLLSGMIVYRGFRPVKTRLALFGLFNFATVAGMWFAARRLSFEEGIAGSSDAPSHKGIFASYLTAFSLLFVALVVASFAAIVIVTP